jgi:hypothetical protein
MADIEAQLRNHLKNAADWEKMEAPVPGVFIGLICWFKRNADKIWRSIARR